MQKNVSFVEVARVEGPVLVFLLIQLMIHLI